MRAGLNHLPWMMPDAQKKKMGKFDCMTCQAKEPLVTRRVMHCGFLPEATWGPKPITVSVGPETYPLQVCPGYVARLPAVVEGREAHDAMETGTLALYDPHGHRVVHAAAMVLKRAMGIHQLEQIQPAPHRLPGAR